MELLNNLPRVPIAALRARLPIAYLYDMYRQLTGRGAFTTILQKSLIAMVLMQAGCAANLWKPADHGVTVEKVSHDEQVRLSAVSFQKTGKGIIVTGELNAPRPVVVSGHVKLEVINVQDKVLVARRFGHLRRYGKPNKPVQRYLFSVEIAFMPPSGSRINVIYDVESR
jgi:hypothetical protein